MRYVCHRAGPCATVSAPTSRATRNPFRLAAILIVEDDAELRNNLGRFLLLEAHAVIDPANRHAILYLALRQQPALVKCLDVR